MYIGRTFVESAEYSKKICIINGRTNIDIVMERRKGRINMMKYDEYIGKMVELTYSDLDGETVCAIGRILYTLKERAFVFETVDVGRQMIVYNRHVQECKEMPLTPPNFPSSIAPDYFA